MPQWGNYRTMHYWFCHDEKNTRKLNKQTNEKLIRKFMKNNNKIINFQLEIQTKFPSLRYERMSY